MLNESHEIKVLFTDSSFNSSGCSIFCCILNLSGSLNNNIFSCYGCICNVRNGIFDIIFNIVLNLTGWFFDDAEILIVLVSDSFPHVLLDIGLHLILDFLSILDRKILDIGAIMLKIMIGIAHI